MANRILTDTATITWDEATPGQVKGNVVPAGLAGSFQPLDADLTAIAALTTTAYGRSLLALASATALAAQVDSFFLTPAEGNAAYQPLDADLTELAAIRSIAAIHAFNFQNYR